MDAEDSCSKSITLHVEAKPTPAVHEWFDSLSLLSMLDQSYKMLGCNCLNRVELKAVRSTWKRSPNIELPHNPRLPAKPCSGLCSRRQQGGGRSTSRLMDVFNRRHHLILASFHKSGE